MPANATRGNMYNWLSHTHNPIKGACFNPAFGYGCRYCYMGFGNAAKSPYYTGPLKLYEKELGEKYKPGNSYFVGSSCDLWHPNVSDDDIGRVLSKCQVWHNQCPASLEKPKFLFQSKNPVRFQRFAGEIPYGSMLATTYETDNMRVYGDTSRAPRPSARLRAMMELQDNAGDLYKYMLSIEPVLKWSELDIFVAKILRMKWDLISIGADSCEAIAFEKQPSAAEVSALATMLSIGGAKVVIKSNCANLAGGRDFSDHWESQGFIYHRPSRKAKEPVQESFL